MNTFRQSILFKFWKRCLDVSMDVFLVSNPPLHKSWKEKVMSLDCRLYRIVEKPEHWVFNRTFARFSLVKWIMILKLLNMIISVFSKDDLKSQIKEKIFKCFTKINLLIFLESIKETDCFSFYELKMLACLSKIHWPYKLFSNLSGVLICSRVQKGSISKWVDTKELIFIVSVDLFRNKADQFFQKGWTDNKQGVFGRNLDQDDFIIPCLFNKFSKSFVKSMRILKLFGQPYQIT